jgi:hypothetical protein
LCSFEQSIAQPRCIAPLKAKGLTEYPGFVPPPRMRRVQTIILDLAHIEDCFTAVRQTPCHCGRLASRPVERKPISDNCPRKLGREAFGEHSCTKGNGNAVNIFVWQNGRQASILFALVGSTLIALS